MKQKVNLALWAKRKERFFSGFTLNVDKVKQRRSLRYAVMLLCALTLAIGNAWGSSSYYSEFTAKSSDGGKGLVYAAGSNSEGNIETYSNQVTPDKHDGSSGTEYTWYAWAKAARGNKFVNWTKGSNINSSGSLTNAATTFGVKHATSDGSTVSGNATAHFSEDTPYTITFKKPENFGGYTAEYANYTISNNKFVDYSNTITMTSSSSDRNETSYESDIITLTATARTGNFLGWYNGSTLLSTKGDGYTFSPTSAMTIEGRWEEIQTNLNITFKAVEKYDSDNYKGSYTVGTQVVQAGDYVENTGDSYYFEQTLTAIPATGYAFLGWYTKEGVEKKYVSFDNPYNAYFDQEITLYADFAFSNYSDEQKAQFKVGSTYYTDLNAANTAASSGSDKTIVCTRDGVLPPGNYTISSGVKLYIPYNTSETSQTEPKVVTAAAPLSVYRKLILLEGSNVIVSNNGVICVGGQIMSANGGSPSAYPTGDCGMIDMSAGGHIELNSGATLYVWGFIKGQDMDQGNNTIGVGTINAKSGANIWEDFWLADWRGGSACSCLGTNSGHMMFPFQGYTMQNIEVPTTYNYGSTLNNYINVFGNSTTNSGTFATIGSTNTLFLLKDAKAKVCKWYDPTTDLVCYELSGTTQIDALNVDAGITEVSSSDYNLPITSNMHVIINSNITISKPMTVLPGAVLEIRNGFTATISDNLYIYDTDDWGKGVLSYYFYPFKNLTSHKSRGTGTTNDLEDAKLIVDGSLNITGKIYSTTGGSNIMGNGGGKITLPNSLYGSPCLYQAWGAANGTQTSTTKTLSYWFASTDTYVEPITVNSANLHNEDGSYTQSIASTTFHNVNGRWFAASAKDEKANHTYDFTYISSGAVSGTDGTTSTVDALYAADKTGLVADMKWCNVEQDATCSNIFNAIQPLNETPASDIRYTYPSSEWLQLIKTETEGVYGGSDNSLYAVEGCAVNSLGSVDENCLYTINEVKKALVDGHFVALEKNTEDEAWHDVANPTNYYICFEGCNWHPATKYTGEEKAYIVEESDYIWYNNNWLLVEREDPFFFDYNDQNVKRYYEYANGAWVLAEPRVRVVDAIETRDFYTMPEAITVASGKKNVTITILKDISGINTEMTYTAKNTTCTLDLNGHIVSGACAKLLTINASGSTFTITDNTTEKNGRLENIFAQNAVTYNVTVTGGTLNIPYGTIHAENPAQYASKAATVNSVAVTALTGCGARAVQVAAAQKLNISGGRLEAYATRNAYGIVASGNNANTTQVTITDGEIYAEAPCGAYGISCSGKLNISGGLVEAKLNDHLVDASYAADNASYNLNKHAECYAVNMTASANATVSSCYFGTLTVTGGTIKASSDLVRSYTSNVMGIRMSYSVAGKGNRNFASTSGTNAEQACAIGSVKNAEILVQNNANYGYGIMVYGHYNSYNKTNSVFKVENTTVDVKAFNYAYGVYACGGIDGTTGECFTGDVELTNCTIAAEATNATTTASYAYGAWVYAGATTIFQDKQANYYGEYATAAKMTINGGSITAKTKTHYAYTAGTNTRARSTYGPQTSVYASRTRGGNAEAYPTLIINGGTYRAISGQQHARGISSGGNTTVKDAIFHITAGTYNTYGLYAISGKLTATNVIVNDTAKSHSSNNANVYGVLVDCSIPSGNTAQTGFAYAGEVELNNCTITAVSPSYSNARALYVNATNKVHNWTQFLADSTSYTSTWAANKSDYAALYRRVFPCTIEGRDSVSVAIAAKAIVNGGTFTAKAGRASAYGAVSTQTSVPANKEVTASPEMTLKNATFTAQTGTSTTAYGVQAGGPTLIEGCTITATSGNSTKYQSTASGVRALDKTTTIKNSTITATATDAAYGLEGYVEINTTHGYCWHGEFDLSEAGTTAVTAEAKTSGKKAYTIYLNATKRNIASGNFAGDYATAANATINGGTYVATAGGSNAYVISLAGKQTQGSVVAQPEVEVLDGYFNGATAEIGTAGVVGHTQLKGGYYVHNTNLATYAVAPKSVWTLPTTHAEYANGYRYKITEHYTVTFMNGTTQLQQNDLEAGETPEYTGETPTKDADAQYTYTFNGWDNTIVPVTAAATYNAVFSTTTKKYMVTFKNGEDVLQSSEVEYGTTPTYTGETPTKDATAQYTYTFTGWDNTPVAVTGEATYTAQFSSTVNKYAITFKNGEDVLQSSEVEYGTTPTYTGATPTKDADAAYTYTFNGWDAEIVAVTGEATYNATYTATPNVVLGDLTVDDEQTLDASAIYTTTTVTTTGTLTVPANKTLTTTDLILEATTSTSGQLFIDDNVTVTGNAYFDLTLNAQTRTWYGVGVPWAVDPSNGIYGDGKQLRLGKDFDIIWYDGETRAAAGPVNECYKYLEDYVNNPELRDVKPGRMYFMFFARPYNVIRFAKKAGASLTYTGVDDVERFDGPTDVTNHNWNGIANSHLTHVTVAAHATINYAYRYKNVNIDENKTSALQWELVTNFSASTYVVGQPVMVQVPASGASEVWNVPSSPASAPLRKMAANGDIDRAEVLLTSANGLTDRILCVVNDEAKDEYTLGDDLVKFTNGAELPQMWINNYKHALAVNTIRLENSIATYPLTIVSPKAGDYTLSLVNKLADGIHLYLTLNGEAIADLTEGAYTLPMGKETNKAYGLRLVRGPRGTVTDIDEALEGKDNAEKVIMDGVLYIIRQGKVYDAQGHLIDVQNK